VGGLGGPVVDAQGAEPYNGYEEDCGEEEVDAFGVEENGEHFH